jgi:hypothetical protein
MALLKNAIDRFGVYGGNVRLRFFFRCVTAVCAPSTHLHSRSIHDKNVLDYKIPLFEVSQLPSGTFMRERRFMMTPSTFIKRRHEMIHCRGSIKANCLAARRNHRGSFRKLLFLASLLSFTCFRSVRKFDFQASIRHCIHWILALIN